MDFPLRHMSRGIYGGPLRSEVMVMPSFSVNPLLGHVDQGNSTVGTHSTVHLIYMNVKLQSLLISILHMVAVKEILI